MMYGSSILSSVFAILYMLVRYASPSDSMCLGYLMLTLSGHVESCFCFLLPLGLFW